MKHFPVVVAVTECFDEDRGAFEMVTLWDGVALDTVTHTAKTDNAIRFAAKVDATHAQKLAAAAHYKATVEPAYNNRTQMLDHIGHAYIVGGSRKVAKGTVVVVVDQIAAGYDSRYNRATPAQVLVEFEGGSEWISTNCLKVWVCGVSPWWTPSDVTADDATTDVVADVLCAVVIAPAVSRLARLNTIKSALESRIYARIASGDCGLDTVCLCDRLNIITRVIEQTKNLAC